MIEHRVKFDRPMANAHLASIPSTSSAQLNSIANSAPQTLQVNTESTPELLANIAKGLDSIKIKTDSVTQELSSLSIALARMMVQKLVGHSEELQERRLSAILLDAISRPEPTVGVYLNPGNIETIHDCLDGAEAYKDVALIADESIALGECRVEFDAHDLVSSLEHQLDEIEARLSEIIDEA